MRLGMNKMLEKYFEPKSFESKEFYERLGVKKFKKIVPTGGDYVNKLFKFKIIKNKGNLETLINFTKRLEIMHLTLGVVYSILMAKNLIDEEYHNGVITFGMNALINIYPIMLQRYNRIRANNILNKPPKNLKTNFSF